MTAALCLSLCATGAAALDTLKFNIASEDDDLRDALRSASLVRLARDEERTGSEDIIAAALADYRRLLSVLYQNGRYSGVVKISIDGREAASINLLRLPERIARVEISVTPGPRFRLGRAEIAPLAPGDSLPPEFRTGETARSTVIQDAVQSGIDGWRQEGHAKAAVAAQKLTANHADRRVDAQITLDPGPQLRFGTLQIDSSSKVPENRLRKIAGLPSGEVYDPDEVTLAAKRLRRTGTFSSVTLTEAEAANPDGTLDFGLEVADSKPRRFGFGAEIASLEGLTLSAFWMHRNITNRADRLRIDGEIAQIGGQSGGYEGGVDYSIGLRFDRPAVYGPDTGGFAYIRLEREDEPTYLQDSFEIGIGATRYISDELEAELAVAYTYSEETDDYGTDTFSYISLPGSLTWDTRDTLLDATEGQYVELTATPFAGFKGTGSGGQITADARVYRRTSDRLVLAGRLQFGSLIGPDIEDTPADFLFYSGGGGTVRGQPYQSLFVTQDTGEETGGRSFLGLSAEVRAEVTEAIGLVAFADAGYIGEESFIDGSGEWHAGAGLGLRYNTGIGPIRLDVAAPVSGDTGDGVQIYVGIGQAF
ncbi:autotransporter assembly complex protein TamA [Aliishimia ponticola]|uniref:autotransporter assembly complex protein TamA n=1 Tax=Aliishimia ponticola TaxID=2499833 RepID=UPI001FEC6FD0|nr:autotransporter assembly complex family protein [Aliishimia ponticola]